MPAKLRRTILSISRISWIRAALLFGAATVIAAGLLFWPFGRDEASSRTEPARDAVEELLAGDTDPIATVNGRAIPAAKLRAYQALTSPDGPLEIERPPLTAEGYVDMLVENELLYQEAERRGLIPSDEEVLAAARQYKAQLLDALQADTPEVARIQEYFRQIEGTPYHYEQYDKSPVMLDAFRRMIAIGRLRQSIIEAMPPGERGDFDKREAAVNELVAALRADADIQINLR